ncbi:probable trehalose-phosphate phosphatase 6 [Zingiber officinale]|uniref:probable trehalose-phosphate phosphatase 6 n=1 Tax=Zingiber officinale TaxID=94328 RepID=UPI001C4C532E|nr:probable trehalose-phosphate phosphatase 6 [Zingiber officinale]
MVSVAEMRKQNVIVTEELALSRVMAAGGDSAFLGGIVFNCKIASQLEILNSGWLDSLRASSPTRVKAAGTAISSSFAARQDQEYENWVMQHPSALRNFGDIVAGSKGKRIVMFLDYDGTLSPIVDDPDRAFMSDAMREAVRNVARHFPTAIVSGRRRDKVYNFVQLRELYYAGSHGMDIKGPSKGTKRTRSKNKALFFQPASQFLPVIHEVYEKLVEKTSSIPGSRIENNTFTLSVHFRCIDEKKWSSLTEQVGSVLLDYPQLMLTVGRKVLEVRPTIKWDKGKALEFLLESLGFANCSNVFPVYIGDDNTDEDAFRVLHEREQGVGILVSKVQKKTTASFSLRDPTEVMEFLHRLVE